MVMSSVELRTVNGETITLTLPSGNPTVADAVSNLRTHHGYAPGVALMFASRVLDNQRHLAEFPDGNIIIAGHTAKQGGYDSRRAQAAGRTQMQPQPAYSQQQQSYPTRTQPQHAHSPQQQSRQTVPAQHQSPQHRQTQERQPQPQRQQGQGLQPPRSKLDTIVSPVPQERGSTTWKILLHVPARNETVSISVPDDCTVETALFTAASVNPAFAKARLVFTGKLLTDSPKVELKSFGVKDGSTLMMALGSADANDEYNNPTAVKLFEVEKEFENLKIPVVRAGGITRLPDMERKMFFENSMKLLYRLDALEGLPATFRQRRKDLVQSLQAMQDEAQSDN